MLRKTLNHFDNKGRSTEGNLEARLSILSKLINKSQQDSKKRIKFFEKAKEDSKNKDHSAPHGNMSDIVDKFEQQRKNAQTMKQKLDVELQQVT